ncbi:polysaccharide deacetylase family protein [Fibrobacter sp. UBA4297]|uniref:polysaccharide deacetylase family protein n=1 Tax=Fibrobacter sp. UBA4297 TaxID=1946536 RepID=UPI0025B80FD4|nr:polysaccharide deacetylase family protein [Fibrobacter sp. UBA4297]
MKNCKNGMRAAVVASCVSLCLTGLGMAETPIKTVPWNGCVGAVSFTFDDAYANQVQNLKPILDDLPDVHVTFFLTSMGNGLKQNASGFAALAKAGNEMGNHTQSHPHLTGVGDSELEEEIVKFANTIESTLAEQGADVKVTSLATPFCENNDKIKSVIASRHFINRDCGWHGRNDWDTEPDWMSLRAKIWTRSGATVAEMLSALDTAAFIGNFEGANPWDVQVKDGSWLVVLNHGVTDDVGDDYAINPSDIKKIFEHAVENKLWVAPFGTVGAYYRAHFVVDAATAKKTDDGFWVTWEIPNEHMPKSVPLRVKIDTQSVGENAVVEQAGKKLTPERDGSYIIEFMAKELKVRKSSSNDETMALPKSAFVKHAYSKYTVFDMNGNCLGETNGWSVPANYPKGTYFIRAEAAGGKAETKKLVK